MAEENKYNFHESALQSVLFKGHPELYFCCLKSEKIAHALVRLVNGNEKDRSDLEDMLLRTSTSLPGAVLRFAAGELDEPLILADVFEMLSLVRLAATADLLSNENGAIIAREYEYIIEKISLEKNVSPFLSLEELAVPPLLSQSPLRKNSASPTNDGHIGQVIRSKGQTSAEYIKDKTQTERTQSILKILKSMGKASIKDLSRLVKNCSEKTIQRELNSLIKHGLVRKEGERRWSVYFALN